MRLYFPPILFAISRPAFPKFPISPQKKNYFKRPSLTVMATHPNSTQTQIPAEEKNGGKIPPPNFQIVVAADRNLGIGKDGALPWSVPGDLKYFKQLTSVSRVKGGKNVVIMGRKCWESIPEAFRPLRDRINVVLSRRYFEEKNEGGGAQDDSNSEEKDRLQFPEGVVVSPSFSQALETLSDQPLRSNLDHIFVIGGGEIYREAIQSDLCEAIHITRIDQEFNCDVFFPEINPEKYKLWCEAPPVEENQSGVRYAFQTYTRVGSDRPPKMPKGMIQRHEEYQYLDHIRDILKTGALKDDRTGTGTFSKFGLQMRFNLRNSFPLLTTKRVFWRGVVEELLWFLSGTTNAKLLEEKGVGIWKGNGSKEFLESIGLGHREEGDLGPVYGFQWRHFGATYIDMHADYKGKGVDQLADVLNKIKNKPNDRRIVMSAWNPADLKIMALPPCHMFCQFYVAHGELSCQMYQRSCDMGLGVPFNIASYSLLTCMVAQVCGLKPGDFIHVLGDAHVYTNHVEPLKQQLENDPRHFPTLKLNADVKNIEDFKFSDVQLDGYSPHKKIAMEMAV